MNEANFLDRLRGRKTQSAPPPHPGRYPGPARTLPPDLAAEFATCLTAVGGHVHHVADAAEARVALRDILEGRSLRRALLSAHPILRDLELDHLLRRLEIEPLELDGRLPPPADLQSQLAAAGLGLTGVEYAVAASGTLVMAASPFHARSISLLPPLHVAVLHADQLLPDLAALMQRVRHDYPDRLPSGLVLITGPSRTADIEQTLSVGVHGPAEVHILLLPARPQELRPTGG